MSDKGSRAHATTLPCAHGMDSKSASKNSTERCVCAIGRMFVMGGHGTMHVCGACHVKEAQRVASCVNYQRFALDMVHISPILSCTLSKVS